MALLTLDIGNTHTTAGLFDGVQLVAQWRISTQRERTSDEYAVFLKVAFDGRHLSFARVEGVAVSSVVPSLTPQAAKLARDYFSCEALVVGPDTPMPVKNDYANPREVGADRLVNALAAWRKYASACIIVDFGTATTVDAISGKGHYLGGAIAPGLGISTDALFRAAARLPRVELLAPGQTLARDTVSSMQAGIVYGYAGLVKELVSRCQAEIGESATVIATGGLAELIAAHVPLIQHVEPELTLDGLRVLWEETR